MKYTRSQDWPSQIAEIVVDAVGAMAYPRPSKLSGSVLTTATHRKGDAVRQGTIMIAIEAVSAVVMLHDKSRWIHQNYWLDRYEYALDECVRNPGRTSPATHQARSAVANAKKRIDGRERIVPTCSFDHLHDSGFECADAEIQAHTVEILQWLETTSGLTPAERGLLLRLARGEDAETIADAAGVPLHLMRQRISRARASARAAWHLDSL